MSEQLIEAVMQGDASARRQLVEQHYSSFMAMARRYARNNQQADTFFHNAFLHVFQQLGAWRTGGDTEAWLKETFLASIIQQLKSNKSEYYVTTTTRIDDKKKPDSDLFNQAEDDDVNGLSAEEFIRAIQQLPASFRAVYNMQVIEQYPFPRISQLLEVSEASAQNTLERAKNQLAKNLQLLMQGYA
jgi:RNA polymerase sigma factor (sigma-70 family)